MGFYHDEITLLGHGRAVIEKGKQQYLFDIENDRVITALPAGVDLMPFNDETVTWMYKKGTYYGIIDEDGHILYEDTKDPLTRAEKMTVSHRRFFIYNFCHLPNNQTYSYKRNHDSQGLPL